MKFPVVASALLVLTGIQPASAQSCQSTETRLYISTTDSGETASLPNVTMAGKMFCSKNGGANYDTGWQEFHESGGALIDHKRGALHPTDPTKRVGSWSMPGNGLVAHTYGTTSYSWAVCLTPSTGNNVRDCRTGSCNITLRGSGGNIATALRTTGAVMPCP